VDEAWVGAMVPAIAADAHKGVRKRLAVIGGAHGMAGATVLAARGAARSGIGMVRIVAAPESVGAVQSAVVEATAAPWPNDDAELQRVVGDYADVVAAGPGLGRDEASRELLVRLLRVWRGPTVLDADALTLFAGRAETLGEALGGRPAVLTPHASEFARLAGCTVDEVLRERFERPRDLARVTGAVVVLKGVPTVVASPAGELLVSAAGTPALAAAGAGDLLTGVVATLLGQTGDAFASAAAGAWCHGRAAEIATTGRPTRGVTLDDVTSCLSHVWRFGSRPAEPYVLAELPAVGERRDAAPHA
jgi:NAD(P)H-hydrate epimerase